MAQRVALVTGAAGNIGAACAEALAAQGCDLVLNVLGSEQVASTRAIESFGRRAVTIAADVGDEAAVEAMFRDVDRHFGRIDVLVNNAGIARAEDIFDTSLDSWNAVLRTNLTGAFLCARAAMQRMRRQGPGGRIIQMSSVVAHQGALKGHVHYAASKAGLIGLTKTLARTAAPLGITVNAVAPGVVDTDMLSATHGAAGVEDLRNRVPLGVLATPADVAAAVAYLASPAAGHVTGAVIDVNGGLLMR